ncbi:MAG TPA: DUF3300 domain-containing protein [Opitutaceae bacterium]|nr:DUF3300 domain-containing protein [Opitutaceae bacterium]
MKTIPIVALLVPFFSITAMAQTPTAQPPALPPISETAIFTAGQLDQLLASIALYPDPLIALILPASTDPSDVVLAARYLAAGGDPNDTADQPWDDSVKALAHYPEVIRWMDQNLEWTQQLGQAFAGQSADVMNAIQRLRAQARAVGNLGSTPQQQVVVESDGTIAIIPTQSQLIYVPYYNPTLVYAAPPYYGYQPTALFGFSAGFATGWWLSYGFDWHHRSLWCVDRDHRERYWREHRDDWHRIGPGHAAVIPAAVHVWRPRHDWQTDRRIHPTRPPQNPGQWQRDRDRDHDFRSERPHSPDQNRRPEMPGDRRPTETWRERNAPVPALALRSPLSQPLPSVHAVPNGQMPGPGQRFDRPGGGAVRHAEPPPRLQPSGARVEPQWPRPGPARSYSPPVGNPGMARPAPEPRPAPPMRYAPPAPPPSAAPRIAPPPPPPSNAPAPGPAGDRDGGRRFDHDR